jgi:hypothetical protein
MHIALRGIDPKPAKGSSKFTPTSSWDLILLAAFPPWTPIMCRKVLPRENTGRRDPIIIALAEVRDFSHLGKRM